MAAPQVNRKARGRLATNDNETIVVADELDTEAHRLAANENETVVIAPKNDDDTVSTDEPDTEAHRLAANDNETTVKGLGGSRAMARSSPRLPTRPAVATRRHRQGPRPRAQACTPGPNLR